jgi:hypothetical protein
MKTTMTNDKNDNGLREYQSPEIEIVEMLVENGFQDSGPGGYEGGTEID